MKKDLLILLFALVGITAAFSQPSQWSYRHAASNRVAYLWLPTSVDGHGVRGLIMASLASAEERFVTHPLVRQIANEERLGILYFSNGGMNNPSSVGDTSILITFLNEFASQSGFSEIRHCPWLAFGSSTSGNFSRFLATWKPSRTIGHILYKSTFGDVRVDNTNLNNTLRPAFASNPEWQVPLLILNGQYEEYSSYFNLSNQEIERFTERKWRIMRDSAIFNRQRPNPYLVSAACAAGEGHFDWSSRADTLIAMFIKKATQARVPPGVYAKNGEITLNIINENTGWLGDTTVISGTPNVYPFADSVSVKGNKFWFFDSEFAHVWRHYHLNQFGKTKDSVAVRANPTVSWNSTNAQYLINNQPLTTRFTLFDTLSNLGKAVKYRLIAGGGFLNRNAANTADSIAPNIINIADANATFGTNRRVLVSAYTESTASQSYRDVSLSIQYNTTSSNNTIRIGIAPSPSGWRTYDTAIVNSNATHLQVISGPGQLIDGGTRLVFTRVPNNNLSMVPLRIRAQGSGAQINNFKDTLINVMMYPYGIGADAPIVNPDRATLCNGKAVFKILNPISGYTYKWYSRNGALLSTTDSLVITSATENDTIRVRAFRSANDSSLASIVYFSIPSTGSSTPPTDNPYRTRYNPSINHWTDSLKWNKIYLATNYGINVCNTPEANSIALQALNTLVSDSGGGVIFFPAGTYPFKESIYLKTGVILRGETPAVANAKDSAYRPQSKLLFPRYIPTFTGNGTPINTAFKHIDADTNAYNIAIVNLDINRAAIDIHPKQYQLGGASNTAQPVDVNKNVLVFGIRSNNVALPDPAVPNTTQTTPQFGWQRWSFRFAGNIDIFGAGNMIVANCRINDEVTDNFEQPNYQYNNMTPDCSGAPPSATIFNYTDHYGIVVNRNKFQIGGSPVSSASFSGGSNAITGATYYTYAWKTGATPQDEPYLFMPGNEVLDNWVFKTMRIGLQASGIGLIIKGNETYDIPNKTIWLTPTGTGCQLNNSATYENRGLDFSGWNVTIDSNIIGCYRHRLKNTIYFTVDGEGILLQECCGGTSVNDYKITRNRLVQEGYIGIYKMGDINNLLIKDNNLDGREILVQANISAGGTGQEDHYRFLSDMLLEGNIGVSRFNINGNRGGRNNIIRNNIMTPIGADTNIIIPCHVTIEPNNTNVRNIAYTPVRPYDTTIVGMDTILNTPAPRSVHLRVSGPCSELNVVRVALLSPAKDTIFPASTSSILLRAKVVGGNVPHTKVRFLVNNTFVSPDNVFAGADSTVSFTFNIPGVGFYNITARANDTLAKTNAFSPTYKVTISNPFAGAIVPDFAPSVVCKSLTANFTNLSIIPDGDTLVSAEWDFTNDGTFDQSTSTLSNVSFTYPAYGDYNVRLRINVKNANRGSGIFSETITKTIRLLNPIASFTPSQTSICIGGTINFTPIHVNHATAYEWDFDNNGVIDSVRSSATMVSNTFNTSGTFAVRLRVLTTGGCKDSTTQNITVNPVPTVTFSISDDTVCAGETVTFTALASASMSFTLEPDTASSISSQTGSGVSFTKTLTYNTGTFFPKLTASHLCASFTKKDTIVVYESPDKPSITATPQSLGTALLTANIGSTLAPFTIRWYRGTSLITGANNSFLTVNQFGTYFVEVLKGNCATKSDGLRVDNILGNLENKTMHDMQLYPNPIEDAAVLLLSNNHYGILTCQVYTLEGKFVKQILLYKQKDVESFTIDFSEFKSGSYLMRIQTNESSSVIPILKK
ncbi:MAG: PKD domain-containing protein [Cytophagales bacterium]|nr:PKD domain-containing protein [Cytophagales bacterium]MDW8384075.1 PKD domain-containing protein [Flammeovirgaceae bacterium]